MKYLFYQGVIGWFSEAKKSYLVSAEIQALQRTVHGLLSKRKIKHRNFAAIFPEIQKLMPVKQEKQQTLTDKVLEIRKLWDEKNVYDDQTD